MEGEVQEQLPEGNSEGGGEESMLDKLANKFGPEEDAPEEGQDQPEGAPESELIEISVDGKSYQVQKELKDSFLRHVDYTQKTQDIASRARIVDAQARMLQEQAAFAQATVNEQQQLAQLAAQIQSYGSVDMSRMDSDTLLKTKIYFDQLKDQYAQLKSNLDTKATEFSNRLAATRNEMAQEGYKILSQRIPGYGDTQKGDEVRKALMDYGRSAGYNQHELDSLTDPRMVETLWKAQQWDQLQSGKSQVMKRANEAAPVIKPGASNPQMSRRMESLNFKKQLKAAPTPQGKAELIRKRLERMV